MAVVAKAYEAHWQVVCAIMYQKGENRYLKPDSKGMSFGVRRVYIGATENRKRERIAGLVQEPLEEGGGNFRIL